jgi:hypothetical protein
MRSIHAGIGQIVATEIINGGEVWILDGEALIKVFYQKLVFFFSPKSEKSVRINIRKYSCSRSLASLMHGSS